MIQLRFSDEERWRDVERWATRSEAEARVARLNADAAVTKRKFGHGFLEMFRVEHRPETVGRPARSPHED